VGERGLFAPALLVARPALTQFVPPDRIVGTPDPLTRSPSRISVAERATVDGTGLERVTPACRGEDARRLGPTGADMRSTHADPQAGSASAADSNRQQNLTQNLTVTSTPDFDESSVPVTLVLHIE
jgi:hypothetical protein